ncbi:MAG: PD-(D/E)XK nuclease family protein, partial [Betaproteobacteria bacterium]
AITRARQVFIASGIENAKAGNETPYRRLETALEKLGGGLAFGEPLPLCQMDVLDDLAQASTQNNDADKELPPVGERRRLPDAGVRFGILLHALLERRTGGEESAGWWKGLGFDDGDYQRVLPVAERLLTAPALQRFFDPAHYRRAWNEVDLSGNEGQLLRLDRLVEFDDALWVVDYKSSGSDTERLAEYQNQVEGYCRAVAGVFPARKVRGALIFSDASILEVC